MAFLFGCENVHLEYPTKVIFESLSLGVDDGDCVYSTERLNPMMAVCCERAVFALPLFARQMS